MPGERGALTVAVVAGEPSGDLHGGALCRALAALHPGVRLVGMGGPAMAAAGAELLLDFRGFAFIGFTDWLTRLPALYRRYRAFRADLRRARPDVVVLIDCPGLNLRLAGAIRRWGVPAVYYLPPQVWAWRRGRLRTIGARVRLVLAALPFEPRLYAGAGVPVAFVGHPVLDAVRAAPSPSQARRLLGLAADDLVVGLLPGSREGEIERMTPLLTDAARRIAARRPGARFLVPLAPTVDPAAVRAHLAGFPADLVEARTHAVMRAADLLLVTSGTATLEAAVLGTPMVVAYRVSALTELLARMVLRVPWISLVNNILGESAVPELCRRRTATGEQVAAAALRLLESEAAREAQRAAFRRLRQVLGEAGVADRAARLVLATAGGERVPAGAAARPETAIAGGEPAPSPAPAPPASR